MRRTTNQYKLISTVIFTFFAQENEYNTWEIEIHIKYQVQNINIFVFILSDKT